MYLSKIFTLIIFIVFGFSALNAQIRSKSYWIAKGHIAKKDKVVFKNYQSVWYETGDGRGHSKIIHADGEQLTQHALYKTRKLETLHGHYQEWYDNGNLWIKGYYVENKKQGQWESYSFPSGFLQEAIIYKGGLKNGQFVRYDSLGNVVFKAHYRDDELSGPTIRFSPEGDTIQICHYVDGLQQGCSEIETTIPTDLTPPEEKPYISTAVCAMTDTSKIEACRQRALYKAIFNALSYPKKDRSRGVIGKALVSFVIEKDGSISNVQTKRGISNGIEKASLKALNALPQWVPGKRKGEPVRVRYNLPIGFKLE